MFPRVHDGSSGKLVPPIAGVTLLVVSLAIAPAQAADAPGIAPAGTRPGEVIENSLGMQLVVIPEGDFVMGAAETAEQLKENGFFVPDGYYGYDTTSPERPVHKVSITRPFLIGVHEVSGDDFLSFYNDGYKGKLDCEKDGKGGWGYDGRNAETPLGKKPEYHPWSWGHPDMDLSTEAGRKQALRHPVVNVSWNDSVAFCEWLSRKEKKKYRLPTEAEWEYACRAGTTTRFWTGDDPESLAASENVADASLKAVINVPWAIRGRDGHAFTSPVGSFKRPNPFGLHDIQGNVKEWCSDWYGMGYYSNSPVSDPKGPSSDFLTRRAYRGGSWRLAPFYGRSAERGAATPALRHCDLGFRVVCELE